jgi:hypothetical protein
MKLTITIDTDNDAFRPDPSSELARILRDLATQLNLLNAIEPCTLVPMTELPVFDSNGNVVGEVNYK